MLPAKILHSEEELLEYKQHLLVRSRSLAGRYDDSGQWISMKHCFMSCEENCNCTPPDGVRDLTLLHVQPSHKYKKFIVIEDYEKPIKDLSDLISGTFDTVSEAKLYIESSLFFDGFIVNRDTWEEIDE